MRPPAHDNQPKGKKFRLVKFFAWASFIVILIFSFPFSMVISQKAKEILLKSYENYAFLLGENLNHQVFQYFVIPVVYERREPIKLRDEKQRRLLDRVVRNTIHGFNVDLVNIHSIDEDVIAYSTDPKLIGLRVKESLGYKKALKGEVYSGLISSKDDLWGLDIDFVGGKQKLRTYIPFRGPYPLFSPVEGYIGGVFELIQDLTPQYESIVKFQYLIFGLSILIMGLIFLALLLIVHKAEKDIEQRTRERLELEEQLNQAERLASLGHMVAGVSHEIKNPLGIIQSTAELLGGLPEASETQKRLSNVITEESGRLNRIVTEFLDFARPQTPNLQECRLEGVISRNLSFLRPELEKRGIRVEANLDGRPYPLKGDEELLYRAFLNILLNAIQSVHDGGLIAIDLAEEKGTLRVEIRDNGKGISAENLSKIFDPFFTTKDKGSGLGLSIVRKIIEGHRGSVHIESKEGEGTCVRIHLPRHARG
ncbi:MAG: GHKL domain-containing protein [Deltaproteobacteria bacterium]|nr:GHKL domain-containing protein [Deltaproteobacteria bacterium]MBW2137129.1 GHKL domain-containing protein [Deltaproteobacteria bacterium]